MHRPTWILGSLLGQAYIHCQLQQRTLRSLCSIHINNNNNNILSSSQVISNDLY